MPVTYNKLWKLLIDKKMKKTDLINKCQISTNVLAKLGKNQYVSLETLEKICVNLDCNLSDIVEIEVVKDNV